MLKKINRITSKKEFDKVKKEGTIFYSDFWGLIKDKTDEGIKFGFVISKKISKKAVVRNKIRRKLAEEVRKNLDKFENGFRGIFLVKKNILDEKGNIKAFKIL
jgi:ribonuclease P protein component